MVKEYLKNYWRKLDNIAKAFSLDDKNNANIFRYSVVLYEDVDKDLLSRALVISLDKFLVFKVKLGTGLFWNYFEFNTQMPVVSMEEDIPCKYINLKKNNDYLFKVTYYKKKINIDIFHILTDGTGAALFFKSIVCNYLSLKYSIPFCEDAYNRISYEDQYLKNYDKSLKVVDRDFKTTYQFEGKINRNINNTYHYIVDIDDLKNKSREYNATITEYLTAIYIYAIYLSVYKKEEKKEIVIAVPINLRKYYQVNTILNFFVCMNINPKIVEMRLRNFSEILNQVCCEFREKLSIDRVKSYLTRDVKLGMNVAIRLVPLFVKKQVIKFINSLVSKSSTSTLSNVGVIDFDCQFKKYIDNVLVLASPSKEQKIRCTICSFDSKLNITMNSNIDDVDFERTFFQLLKEKVGSVQVESNTCVDFIK